MIQASVLKKKIDDILSHRL